MATCRGGSIGLGVLGFFVSASCIPLTEKPVFAQVTPDTTLGVERSVITPNTNVRGFPADLIEGGATRGASLFHSFSEFNVQEGQRVYFASPAGVENILSRVTGNQLSNIWGTLGVNGSANLFLLNPNGIIFSSNAQLDIAGSFVASTANSFVFGNGIEFSATNPQAPPLLTTNLTPGLQHGTTQLATITNSGSLAVGKDLILSADNLDLQGQLYAGGNLTLQAQNTVQVRDSVTTPFIAAAGNQLLIQGNQSVDIFALNHSESGFFSGGDMVLRSADTVGGDAHYWSGGNFRIEQLDGSLGNLFSPYDPIIRSLGDVSFNNYRGTSLHILAGGSVKISGVVIITNRERGLTVGEDFLVEDITLSNGQVVSIHGGMRPTFDVRAGVEPAEVGMPGLTGNSRPADLFFTPLINFLGFPILFPETPRRENRATSADIKIGGVAMIGRNAEDNPADGMVLLTNQYHPNHALPQGEIEVGMIITADNFSDALRQGPTELLRLLEIFGFSNRFTGNGGSVFVDSRSNIRLAGSVLSGLGLGLGLDFGLINTASGTGDAGDITLLAKDSIAFSFGS